MEQRPIVIKRIKKAAHAHHGGSWKVAYADFVTAMMAFFLLMWLMGFTTEGERKAISDFFQSPSAIQAKGGSSTSPVDMGGGMDAPRTSQKKLNQDTMSLMDKDVPEESRGSAGQLSEEANKMISEADKKRLETLLDELKQAIDASQALKPFKDQLLLDLTSEGMRIQIIDKENRPMFDVGSSNLQSYTKGILREIAKVVAVVPNRISIAGHTDARPYATITDYSNWELSAERANACRRELVRGGVGEEKFARVVGLASTALFNKADPYSPINRRISIVVLNREADQAMQQKESSESQPPSQGSAVPETSAVESALPVTTPEPVAPPVVAKEPAPVVAKPVAATPAPVSAPAPAKAQTSKTPSPAPARSSSTVSTPGTIQLPGLPIGTPVGVAPPPSTVTTTKDKKK